MLTRNANGETTSCGKTARRINVTKDKNDVTCPRCIERLKRENWFCAEHGFLEDNEVTLEETCLHCGKSAIA